MSASAKIMINSCISQQFEKFNLDETTILSCPSNSRDKTRLICTCVCGNGIDKSWSVFMQKPLCDTCMPPKKTGKKSPDFEKFIEMVESEGYTVVEKDINENGYKEQGTKAKIQLIDPNGNEYWASYNSWQQGHRPAYLANQNLKLDISEVEKRVEEAGFIWVEGTEYKTSHTPFPVECKCGNILNIKLNSLREGFMPICPACVIRATPKTNKISIEERKAKIPDNYPHPQVDKKEFELLKNNTQEIFKEIDGYPEYQISNKGRVKSKNGSIMALYGRPDGYDEIRLRRTENGESVRKGYMIHRLVAIAFVENPNPEKWKIVNHKNSNRKDNFCENLEWCNHAMNSVHSTDQRTTNGSEKACIQYTMKGEFIEEFSSVREAADETGGSYTGIAKACKGTSLSSGGFKWKYVEEKEVVDASNWKIIESFPNYKISKDGQIYSINKDIIMLSHEHNGSLSIKLSGKMCKISRLVALTYIPNPENLPNVSHKNGNKHDNNVKNLFWSSNSQSLNNSILIGQTPKTPGKPVDQYDIDDDYIQTFDSIKEAHEATGASADTIPLVCNGIRVTSGGYKWKWA